MNRKANEPEKKYPSPAEIIGEAAGKISAVMAEAATRLDNTDDRETLARHVMGIAYSEMHDLAN